MQGSEVPVWAWLALVVVMAGLPIGLVAMSLIWPGSEDLPREFWVSVVVSLVGLLVGLIVSLFRPASEQLPEWVWGAAAMVGLLVPLCAGAMNWRPDSSGSGGILRAIFVAGLLMHFGGLVVLAARDRAQGRRPAHAYAPGFGWLRPHSTSHHLMVFRPSNGNRAGYAPSGGAETYAERDP